MKFQYPAIFFILITSVSSWAFSPFGQLTDSLEVGKPLPDFTLTRVTNYHKTSVSRDDFKGKWLILNFWFTGCTNAIRSFPKINRLHLKFHDRIQFLMVGTNGQRYKAIEEVYAVLKHKYNLRLPTAFDSVLHVKWNIWSMPTLILIDPNGLVRHITTGRDLDQTKLQALLEGKSVRFHRDPIPLSVFDISTYPGSQDTSLVYRSILTKWKGERPMGSKLSAYDQWSAAQHRDGIVLVGYPLERLYKIAYTGTDNFNVFTLQDGSLFYPKVIVEASNAQAFEYDTSYSNYLGRYNYNLAILSPTPNSIEQVKHIFQTELHNVFGYNVSFEDREMEVWRIHGSKRAAAKLASNAGESKTEISPVKMVMRNVPIEMFYRLLIYQLYTDNHIFIDKNETGFEGNIDVDLHAVLTDMQDVNKELQKIGFEIVKEKRKLKVLVIKDKP